MVGSEGTAVKRPSDGILIAVAAIGIIGALATGALPAFKGWLQSVVHGGAGLVPAVVTPDMGTILGGDAQGAATSARDLAATAPGAGTVSTLLGDVSTVVNFDLFHSVGGNIGADELYVTGPYAPSYAGKVSFGGTFRPGQQFVYSGAVSWLSPQGLVTVFDRALAGKTTTYSGSSGSGAAYAPSNVASPVIAGLAALTPQQVVQYQQANRG